MIKQGEALLFADESIKDHRMNSVKSSFEDCCEPGFIYTPLFDEEALMQVIQGLRKQQKLGGTHK